MDMILYFRKHRYLFGVSLCVLCILIAARIHAQGQTPRQMNIDRAWLIFDWSWVFWWEANAEAVISGIVQPEFNEAVEFGKVREVFTTVAISKAYDEGLRVRAILGLGRIGDPGALPVLVGLLDDPFFQVREAAFIALGLNGSEEARLHLLGRVGDGVSAGRLIGAGLFADAEKPEREELAKTVALWLRDSRGDINEAVAIWALRQLVPEKAAELAPDWARSARTVEVAIESVLSVRPSENREHAEFLISTYYDLHTDGSRLPFLREIYSKFRPRPNSQVPDEGWPNRAVRSAAAKAMTYNGWRVNDQSEQRGLDRIRSYALRALKRPYMKVERDTNEVMWRPDKMNADLDDGGYENRWALLAIGHMARAEESEVLIDALRGKLSPRFFSFREAHPSRGFGAVALGYYLRSVALHPEWPDAKKDKRHVRRALNELSRVVRDGSEHDNLRAAALLGLGIAGTPAAAQVLKEAISESRLNEPFTRGFAVLALAMTGERDAAIAVARLMINDSRDAFTTDTIRSRFGSTDFSIADGLGVRAMCFGLGLVSGDEAADLLRQVVGYDFYTTQAAARGLRMCGDVSLVEPLCGILSYEDGDLPDHKILRLSLLALGEITDADGPDRLRERLVAGRIVTWPGGRFHFKLTTWIKKHSIYRYKIFAHPFLYEVMIPSSGGHYGRN
ncbi:MAG: HEAT repeat domain-containing protein [Planctomycetota bacterium]